MGIAYSNGVIRDFAGPYYVSEDNLAFGKTTRYYQLEPENVKGNNHFGFSADSKNLIYSQMPFQSTEITIMVLFAKIMACLTHFFKWLSRTRKLEVA